MVAKDSEPGFSGTVAERALEEVSVAKHTESPIAAPLIQLAQAGGHPQQSLIAFLRPRLEQCRHDVAELDEALEKATKNRWNRAPIAKALRREQKNYDYYEKVLAALEAGYVVMPLMDCVVFAVRVDRVDWPSTVAEPGTNRVEGQMLADLRSDAPPTGEGHYYSNRVKYRTHYFNRDVKMPAGVIEKVPYTQVRAVECDPEIPFPLALSHPQMMDAAQQAMSLMIFDEIAVAPKDAATPGPGSRKRDPVLIGRIRRPSSQGMHYKAPACFLIGWLVRPEEVLV